MKALAPLSVLAVALPLCAGCFGPHRYEPLDPRSVLADSLARRAQGDFRDPLPATATLADPSWAAGEPVFAELLARLSNANPEIRRARAALRAAERRLAAGVPWDDPEVSAGPTASLDGATEVGAAASIELAVPWGGRGAQGRALLADQARAAAEVARAAEREQAFALRAAYVRALAAKAAEDAAEESLSWARKGVDLARKVVKAGGAGSLDVRLLETEARAARLARLEAADALAEARAEIAVLVGSAPSALPVLPPLSVALPHAPVPPVATLRDTMVAAAPALVRGALEVALAERELALERASGWPDLGIGFEAESEADGWTLGLPLSFALPLWNGNREGVAAARGAVDTAREGYRAEMDAAVAALETALERLARLEARRRILEEEILPGHRKALDEGRRALEVSDFDSLRYVELERAHREFLRARAALVGEVLAGRVEVERAVGAPLFPLPGTVNKEKD